MHTDTNAVYTTLSDNPTNAEHNTGNPTGLSLPLLILNKKKKAHCVPSFIHFFALLFMLCQQSSDLAVTLPWEVRGSSPVNVWSSSNCRGLEYVLGGWLTGV